MTKTCVSRPRQSRLAALTFNGLVVLCLLFLGAAGARANIYYVNGSGGSDANSGTRWTAAFATVQAGINASNYGDQVWVEAGTYAQNITLKDGVQVYGGFNGMETDLSQRNWITNVTILDGSNSGSVVTVPSGVSSAAQIDGFTIQHGNKYYGGGIYIIGSAIITNNTITHNTATYGGGIECDAGSPAISNNTISGNTATSDGGGLFSDSLNPFTVAGNTITGNTALEVGGGVAISTLSPVTISGNIISSNLAEWDTGGLSVLYSSDVTITGNTVSNNTAPTHAGITLYSCLGELTGNIIANNQEYASGSGCGGIALYSGTYTLTANTISGNVGGSYAPGGLACGQVSATIYNNTFTANYGGGFGGALLCYSSSMQIIGNSFTYNVAGQNSGAIACVCAALIANNLVAHNKSLGYVGGIGIGTGSPVSILNNTIVDNAAKIDIGGINVYSNPPSYYNAPLIANNIIAFNLHGGIIQNSGSNATLSHNCIYGNTQYNYSGVSPGSGDISVDPHFIDRSALDYRLLPASHCIDAGDDTRVWAGELDLDGNGRIYGQHVDIGAYETQPALINFSIKPTLVVGGLNATGTLSLDMPAPEGGAEVILISDNPAVTGPVTVTIPAGATSQSFPINTTAVTSTQIGAITALYGNAELSATLTVRPIGVKTFTLKPTTIVGGNSVMGTVSLEAPAGPGDITVSFTSSDPTHVPAPANITISAGSQTGTVTISTNAVAATETVTITATANSIGKSAKLTVTQ